MVNSVRFCCPDRLELSNSKGLNVQPVGGGGSTPPLPGAYHWLGLETSLRNSETKSQVLLRKDQLRAVLLQPLCVFLIFRIVFRDEGPERIGVIGLLKMS